jgi:diacylglycerol kinase (ATP)
VSIAIIINPVAGGRPRPVGGRVELARRVAADCGEAADVFITEQHGHARALTRAARDSGARLIVAWGGDGTVNEVATELAFGAVPVAIVPAGSGNGLARELHVPRDPARALVAAIRTPARPMDIGEIGGRLFVNIAGIGFDAHVASRFNEPANRGRGFSTYIAIAVRAMTSYAPARYAITTSDAHLEALAVLVTVANSAQFGNGARIAPGACVDDGLLDLVIMEERSRVVTMCHLPRLFNGTIHRMPGCTMRRIAEATITCDAPMTFHVDGEPIAGGHQVAVRVHPGALQVVAGSGARSTLVAVRTDRASASAGARATLAGAQPACASRVGLHGRRLEQLEK